MQHPRAITIDFESVLIPEVWLAVAAETGIGDLKITTRDEPDFDKLMRRRIEILRGQGVTMSALRRIISTIEPLPGAADFLLWLRKRHPTLIISDTFYEFAEPLMERFGYPTLFCHSLRIDSDGFIEEYSLRKGGTKADVVHALRSLGFSVAAAGDSFNDIEMLQAADSSSLIHAAPAVRKAYPDIPAVETYEELKTILA